MKKLFELTMVAVFVSCVTTFAFSTGMERAAEIMAFEGKVSVKRAKDTKWDIAKKGMMLFQGDAIKTESGSWAFLNVDGTGETARVEISENSNLTISELVKNEATGSQSTLLSLAIGEILIEAKKVHGPESSFEVKTPTSIVGVRGTKFGIKVEALED